MSAHSAEGLRVLLCLAATQHFYDADDEQRFAIKERLRDAFGCLEERFKVRLLGGFDDDLLSHGASRPPNYRAYILLDADTFDTVVDLCAVVKETTVGAHRLWRYVGIDARVGRRLPFVEV